MMPVVYGVVGKLFVTAMLTTCVCLYVLEMSGRWDKGIQDTNDEAGIVAVVFCVGVALSAAGTLLKTIRFSDIPSRCLPLTVAPPDTPPLAPSIPAISPPLALRV